MTEQAPETVRGEHADDAERFLAWHPSVIGPHGYAVGVFSRSITFYRQQIRALNLIYALRHRRENGSPRLAPESKIAVVGAGAFGLTAAAAARVAGYKVYLFEKAQQPLMLQSGCTTRWLHPRSYDWPAPGSQIRDARLPILNWTAARAAEVADMVTGEFQRIGGPAVGKMRESYNVANIKIAWREESSRYRIHYDALDRTDDLDVEAVIYGVGFGTDQGEGTTPYWRNDDLAQPSISYTAQTSYCISGTGDGGLVDLLRLRIRNFRQDRILSEIFEQLSATGGDSVNHRLHQLREACHHRDPREIWQAFEECDPSAAEDAVSRMRCRLRADTRVLLIGKMSSFADCLALKEASFGNALLAYLLYRTREFEYGPGPLLSNDVPSGRVAAFLSEGQPNGMPGVAVTRSNTPIIVRHGTDRSDALMRVGLDPVQIESIRTCHADHDWPADPIYPSGWWDRFTQPKNALGGNDRFVSMEHVPKEMHSHATVFVVGLAAAVEAFLNARGQDKCEFRIALHCLRESSRDDASGALFHQVTNYAGRIGDDVGRLQGVGRTFPAKDGIVGLACQSGRVVVATGDDRQRGKLLEQVRLEKSGAKAVRSDVQGFLAYPLLSPGGTRVIMILFLDIADRTTLEGDAPIVEMVHCACVRFVDSLEQAVAIGAIRAVPDGYKGYPFKQAGDLNAFEDEFGKEASKFLDREPARFRTIAVPDFEASDAGAYRQSGTAAPC